MNQNIRKNPLSKPLALLLAFSLLWQGAFPTLSYALTGGPSDPNQEAFTPANASNMVDLFSGDFSYNIPLLNVPGTDGGYPINLAYKCRNHNGAGSLLGRPGLEYQPRCHQPAATRFAR